MDEATEYRPAAEIQVKLIQHHAMNGITSKAAINNARPSRSGGRPKRGAIAAMPTPTIKSIQGLECRGLRV
jgi:hypothetical protein